VIHGVEAESAILGSVMIDLEQLARSSLVRRKELDEQGVILVGDIDEASAERFSQTLVALAIRRKGETDAPITLYINSGGGSVGSGFAMMEMIYRVRELYKVKVNTVVTGYAYSMGAIVFQAGDTREMGHFSTLMLHSPQWYLSGSDQRIFSDFAMLAQHYKNLVSTLFATRSSKHDAQWWQDFIYSGRDRFLTAPECLELGLCDRVYGAGLPLPPPTPGAGTAPAVSGQG
jgi:ATP-dependent Clp protease protease subunit